MPVHNDDKQPSIESFIFGNFRLRHQLLTAFLGLRLRVVSRGCLLPALYPSGASLYCRISISSVSALLSYERHFTGKNTSPERRKEPRSPNPPPPPPPPPPPLEPPICRTALKRVQPPSLGTPSLPLARSLSLSPSSLSLLFSPPPSPSFLKSRPPHNPLPRCCRPSRPPPPRPIPS